MIFIAGHGNVANPAWAGPPARLSQDDGGRQR